MTVKIVEHRLAAQTKAGQIEELSQGLLIQIDMVTRGQILQELLVGKTTSASDESIRKIVGRTSYILKRMTHGVDGSDAAERSACELIGCIWQDAIVQCVRWAQGNSKRQNAIKALERATAIANWQIDDEIGRLTDLLGLDALPIDYVEQLSCIETAVAQENIILSKNGKPQPVEADLTPEEARRKLRAIPGRQTRSTAKPTTSETVAQQPRYAVAAQV